jgi:hypothetical protein
MAAHNRLVGGSSPLSPTTQSRTNREVTLALPLDFGEFGVANGFVSEFSGTSIVSSAI